MVNLDRTSSPSRSIGDTLVRVRRSLPDSKTAVVPLTFAWCGLTPVVEPGLDPCFEFDFATDASHESHDAAPVRHHARPVDRHEINNFRDTRFRQEPRHEDGAAGHVHLLVRACRRHRCQCEAPASTIVQQRREDTRRVEAGTAEPIDRRVRRDERRAFEDPRSVRGLRSPDNSRCPPLRPTHGGRRVSCAHPDSACAASP